MTGEPTLALQQTDANQDGYEPEPAVKALVEEWLSKIADAKDHWKPVFDQIRKNQDIAYYGADKAWAESDKYVVPILVRHINQAVSTLYAKNPRVVAERKRRLMYQIWDGREDSLKAAMEMAAMGDPNGMMLIQEVLAVRQQHQMFERMGKTLEFLFTHFMDEQSANFKQQLKMAVRRAKVSKVAYVTLDFQRIMEPNPSVTAQIEDVTSKINRAEALTKSMADGDVDEESARLAELRFLLDDLQKQQMLVVREGLVFGFPKTRDIIIDPAVVHLKTLVGAGWYAEQMDMTVEKVFSTYKVDLKNRAFKKYNPDGKAYEEHSSKKPKKTLARVYRVWDKENRQEFTVCEGYCDFLKPPAEPSIAVDRFWNLFPIVFNEVDHDEHVFPPSDVEAAKHAQYEYNRSRESLRQHRVAARPYYVEGGQLSEEEKKRLSTHADHEIISVPALAAGQKIEDLIQRGPVVPIDPNLYEVEMVFNDVLRAVGAQEANLGGISNNGTATESSIAENSRGANQADNVDDLDEMLSELAHAGSQVLLTHMTKEQVVKIVGPGAVWPEMEATREQVVEDLYLKVKAGSSGRPNAAKELANTERAMPVILQLPGVNPIPLVERYANLLDLDVEELIADSLPSIQAMNAIMAKGPQGAPPGQPPGSDPNQQGAEGGANAPGTQTNEPGPQPGYPAPQA